MGECSAAQASPRWATWWHGHLLWPAIVQLLLSVLFRLVLRQLYDRRYENDPWFRRMVIVFVGNGEHLRVPRPQALIALSVAQIASSGLAITLWVLSTYWQRSPTEIRILFAVISVVDFLNWIVNRLQRECETRSLWEVNGIVDVLTIVPTLRCVLDPDSCCAGEDWLSLHFLRSYSLPFCFRRIRHMGVLDYAHSKGRLVLFELWLKACCLVFVMAGAIFTCEILGDPPAMHDRCLTTPNGDAVSMAQMVYWIVVSITTVGYGDWAPRTVLARMLTCLFIMYGIATVFQIQFSFSDMWSRYLEGSGSYMTGWTESKKAPHVVVILGARGQPSKLASLLSGLLLEILHPEHRSGDGEQPPDEHKSDWRRTTASLFSRRATAGSGGVHIAGNANDVEVPGWPNVVVFSPSFWKGTDDGDVNEEVDPTFEAFVQKLGLTREARQRVWFVVGRVTSKADVERAAIASSSLVLVLSDMDSDAPDEDDAQNIFTAMALRQSYPKLQLRLMLARPESKNLAVQSGLEAAACFSGRELKCHLLVQNVRCHGMLPIITGLFKSWDTLDVECFLSTNRARQGGGVVKRRVAQARSSVKARGPLRDGTDSNFSHGGTSGTLGSLDIHRMTQMYKQGNCEAFQEKGSRAWMYNYFHGLEQSIYGFELSGIYDGQSYGQVAAKIFERTGAILVGVHLARVVVCPQPDQIGKMRGGQLCFAVAPSMGVLEPVSMPTPSAGGWRSSILQARQRLAGRLASKGVHVAAARLLGERIKSRVDMLHVDPPEDDEPPPTPTTRFRHHRRPADEPPPAEGSAPPAEARRSGARSRSSLSPRRAASGSAFLEFDAIQEQRWRRQQSADNDRSASPSRRGTAASRPSSAFRESGRADSGNSSRQSLRQDLRRCTTISSVQDLRRFGQNKQEGELVVVVVCNGEAWQQVKTVVDGLMAPYQPVSRTVVVLAPSSPHGAFLEDLDRQRVAVMVGSCLSAEVLVEAGVLEARAVIVMSGQSPKKALLRENFFRDYQAVLCSQELECWCGSSAKEIFTVYELHESSSVSHLPDTDDARSRKSINLEEAIWEGSEDSGSDQERELGDRSQYSLRIGPIRNPRRAITRSVTRVFDAASAVPAHADEEVLPGTGQSVLFNPRFAAGQVFSPELFGTMLGRMFYMPAIIELVEALLMPHQRHQQAFLWQMRIPSHYWTLSFADLFRDMTTGGWDQHEEEEETPRESSASPKSLSPLNRAATAPCSFSHARAPPVAIDVPAAAAEEEEEVGPIVPLAIYRNRSRDNHGACPERACGTGSGSYSILAPMPNLELDEQDWLIVLGSQRFGAKIHSMKLLRGACDPGRTSVIH